MCIKHYGVNLGKLQFEPIAALLGTYPKGPGGE